MSGDRVFRTAGGLTFEPDIDLEACHRDPIHQTLLVQPHGTLLEVDPADGRVRSAAANSDGFLGREPDDILGSPIGDLFPSETVAWLDRWRERPGRAAGQRVVDVSDGRLLIRVFPIGERVGVEVERIGAKTVGTENLVLGTLPVLERLRELGSEEDLFEECVRAVRSITGYDRVMLYRFSEAGHGSVVAEDRSDGADSYLGLHFPASDIPEPARRLYRENPLRYIPDVEAEPVSVVRPDRVEGDRPLDLTYSFLRDVPEVHRQYLRNMGVRSSASVAVRVDGELWGLIACHGTEPRWLGWSQRHACELLGHGLAQRIERGRARARSELLEAVETLRDRFSALESREAFFDRIREARQQLLALVDSTAFYLQFGPEGVWISEEGREEPPDGLVDRVRGCLADRTVADVRSIKDQIDPGWPHSRAASGFLATRIGRSGRHFCAWIRPEHSETVRWGGDPRRPARRDADGELTPRNSFETWTQEVEARCRSWTELNRLAARSLGHLVDDVMVDIQSSRLARINEEREALLKKLEERARTDELTGLANRGELMRQLEEELERTQRYGTDLSVALLDLDHFKQVNDRYGHRAGDRVLERYGRLLDENLRAPDTAGRYGGEEFALILPETDAEEATELLGRILEKARSLDFREDGGEFKVTCSAGVTEAEGADESVDSVLERADRGLYQAKEAGRDRVAAL